MLLRLILVLFFVRSLILRFMVLWTVCVLSAVLRLVFPFVLISNSMRLYNRHARMICVLGCVKGIIIVLNFLLMCIRPITITRFYPSIGNRTFTVPCGKCPECVKKKQSQVEALSVLQANISGRVAFFTFTYNDDNLPIAISKDDLDGPRFIRFQRGSIFDPHKPFCNSLVDCEDGTHKCASLCREDIKKVLKRFRRAVERSGETLDMSYLVFGELGEHHGRPHYHGLFYGLTDKQAFMLRDLWSKTYGYSFVLGVGDRPFSQDDISRVSRYISKYISKGTYTRWTSLMPYMEKPRRQSSLHFGLTDDDTIRKLAGFMMGAIFSSRMTERPDALLLLISLYSLIGVRLSALMVGRSLFLTL